MPNKGWARCLDSVADVLRRGAWYQIVEDTGEHLVLDVNQRRVRLSRADVQVRASEPDQWSIVARPGGGGAAGVGGEQGAGPHDLCRLPLMPGASGVQRPPREPRVREVSQGGRDRLGDDLLAKCGWAPAVRLPRLPRV